MMLQYITDQAGNAPALYTLFVLPEAMLQVYKPYLVLLEICFQ